MQNKLQELTDRLYEEGLSKGKEEGARILEEARQEAGRILTEAREQAEAIKEKATREAAEMKSKVESDLKMASAQTLQDRLDYFTTSYLAKYFVTKNVAVYSGLGFSTLLNAKSETMGHSSNIKDNLHGSEFVLPVGAELLLNNHFTVDLRWNWSPRPLAKNDKAKSILGKSRNQYLALTVGYKFQVF